ncbi:MAG: tetratricopeptide repeat protein [Longimicrobiales bacterium]
MLVLFTSGPGHEFFISHSSGDGILARSLESALERDPHDPQIMYNKACGYALRGETGIVTRMAGPRHRP